MGIFSTSSPFDTDVEKATSELNVSEEWGQIMEICDKVGTSSSNAKDCLRSIVKRLNNADPHVVLQAITLLDACVNNCGKVFQLEVASRDFETELPKLLYKWSSSTEVQDKLKLLIKKWAEGEFKADCQLSLIPALYTRLQLEGIDFSVQPDPAQKAPRIGSVDPDTVSSQQEVDDIAKAIELSLKETSSPKGNQHFAPSHNTSNTLYPSVTMDRGGSSISSDMRKVRALYDFEAAEDNELTFFAGEIIHVTDDSDDNWWKGVNQRGEGLFPANFVTSDLTVEPEKPKDKKGIQFNETVQVKTIKPGTVEIDEGKIDRVLHLLHEADPSDGRSDPRELLELEEEVTEMGPLIDTELEKVDRKHALLTQLSSGLVDALNLYHTLMREPNYPKPPPVFHPPGPPQGVYNGAPPPQHFMPPPPHLAYPPHHPPEMHFATNGMYQPGPPPPHPASAPQQPPPPSFHPPPPHHQ